MMTRATADNSTDIAVLATSGKYAMIAKIQVSIKNRTDYKAMFEAGELQIGKIHLHGVDLDGYVLFHMARDLYQGSRHVRLSELTDPELVSDRIFEWIMTACVIRRHGIRVLREEERRIDRSRIGQ